MKNYFLKFYTVWADFIILHRKNKNLSERYIHTHVASVMTTALLMWAYTFLALFSISSPIPGIVGIVASTIHLLSPMLYCYSDNYLFNASVFIGAGMIHQLTFAFFTGGFDSNIIIWLGILPILAGLVAGRRGASLWALITSVAVLSFLILKLQDFDFPNQISPTGLVISQALIAFGWIFISSVVIWVYIYFSEDNLDRLEASRQRTQNLVNILSHDIATPLMVVSNKLNELIKTPLDERQLNILGKAYHATDRLKQITESLRELRLTEVNKKELIFARINARELVVELKENFSEKLEQKNIRFSWSVSSAVFDFPTSRNLMINQVLGNLLSNAIKFSTPGSEVRLQISKQNNQIVIVLEDDGVGIPEEMREHLFEASASNSCMGTNGEMGTGFGLPIVKNCVDRLGGKISFETKTSIEGASGTCFKLCFPC